MKTTQKVSGKTFLLLGIAGAVFVVLGILSYAKTYVPSTYGSTEGTLEGFEEDSGPNNLDNPIIVYRVEGVEYRKRYDFATSSTISSPLTVRYDKSNPDGRIVVSELARQEKFISIVVLSAGCLAWAVGFYLFLASKKRVRKD